MSHPATRNPQRSAERTRIHGPLVPLQPDQRDGVWPYLIGLVILSALVLGMMGWKEFLS